MLEPGPQLVGAGPSQVQLPSLLGITKSTGPWIVYLHLRLLKVTGPAMVSGCRQGGFWKT